MKILSVSQFINLVNEKLDSFSQAIVEGEVSEFRASKQWISFALKDEETEQVLPCFTTVDWFQQWDLTGVLEDGMKVQVRGEVKVRQKGNFSMFVKELRLAGEGTLKKAYQKLKKKLEQQGFFSKERKRALVKLPQRIGLITSKEARAYSDFLKVLKERMGGLTIYHIDVRVQGKNAIPEIISAFNYFNKNYKELDLIALLRGGGSLEDLQAFNSEKVARAVFSSKVPVVCGVGHEKDITLAGLTADLRASTPSNAAELIVPTREELEAELETLKYKIEIAFKEKLREEKREIRKFFDLGLTFIEKRKQELNTIILKFQNQFVQFKKELKREREELEKSYDLLFKTMIHYLEGENKELKFQKSLLKSYSPQAVLKRGFSIVTKEDKVVKSTAHLKEKDKVKVKLSKGSFRSIIKKIFD